MKKVLLLRFHLYHDRITLQPSISTVDKNIRVFGKDDAPLKARRQSFTVLRPYHNNHNSSWYGIRTGFQYSSCLQECKAFDTKIFLPVVLTREARRAPRRAFESAGPPWRMKKKKKAAQRGRMSRQCQKTAVNVLCGLFGLVGPASFEPAECGVKVPCLTTWRWPIVTRTANPHANLPFLILNGVEMGLEPTTTSRTTIWRLYQLNYTHHLVRPKGLEPLAHCLEEGSCSIHLSYAGAKCKPRSGHCLDILQ